MFCEKCGAKIDKGDRFCQKCGAKVDETLFEETTEETMEEQSAELAESNETAGSAEKNKSEESVETVETAEAAESEKSVESVKSSEAGDSVESKMDSSEAENVQKKTEKKQAEKTAGFEKKVSADEAREKVDEAREKVKQTMENIKRSSGSTGSGIKGLPKKLIDGIAAAVVVLIAAIALLGGNRSVTIDMNKYVTFTESGYQGNGRVSASIDYDQLEADYGDKVKWTKKAKKMMKKEYADADVSLDDIRELTSGGTMTFIESTMDYILDSTSGLSNGDKVTLTWYWPDEMEDYFGAKLKNKTMTYTMNTLSDIAEEDVFENLNVTFEGTGPNGTVNLEKTKTDGIYSEITFTVEPSTGLSNGDDVTVTVQLGADESDLASYYGVKISQLSKTYKVEGLNQYATTFDEIPDETVERMKSQAEDVLMSQSSHWDEGTSISSMTYAGNYMLTRKDDDYWSRYSEIYMIYKVTVNENYPEYNVDNTFSYYAYVEFYDPMILSNGNCTIDVTDYDYNQTSWFSGDKIEREIQLGDDSKTLSYPGYEDLDTFFNKNILDQIDAFNYVESVDTTVGETESSN